MEKRNVAWETWARSIALTLGVLPFLVFLIDRILNARFVAINGHAPDFSNYASPLLHAEFARCTADSIFHFASFLLMDEHKFFGTCIAIYAGIVLLIASSCVLKNKIAAKWLLGCFVIYLAAFESFDRLCPLVNHYLIH